MTNILTIGIISEGVTDERFLPNIIRKTFEELAFECNGEIEVYEPELIKKQGNTFIEQVLNAATGNHWINILCVHTDADSSSDKKVFTEKILPAFDKIEKYEKENICKNLVAIVPIQMTEAWMLSDTQLLIDEIGTDKNLQDLELPKALNEIENISDPKNTIENAIRIAFSEQSPRRKRLSLGELYSPISQKVKLSNLKYLSSYNKFRQSSYIALKKLGYIL